MYEHGLVATLRHAVRMWRYYRRESRQLRGWLRRGVMVFRPDGEPAYPDPPPFFSSVLGLAVFTGADELLFTRRKLYGLPSVELHPAFWTPDWSRALREGTREPSELPAPWERNVEDPLEYFTRFRGFTRFEMWQRTGETVELAGGYETDFFDAHLNVLRENLRRPSRLVIVNEHVDYPVRGRACTISQAQTACGVLVGGQDLGISLAYEP